MADRPARAAVLCLLAVGCTGTAVPLRPTSEACVPRAAWVAPATRRPIATAEILAAADAKRIVLLGERHDWPEDHRWQAHVLSLLHGARPTIVVGLEMLTPDADPALARWAAAECGIEEMLADVHWRRTVGMAPELYRPIFDAVRLLGLGLRGINVDRGMVRRVAQVGWAGLTPEERRALPTPRPPSEAYRARLAEAFAVHRCRPPDADDPAFARFVDAQRTWDAVMARALARLADAAPTALVVGIVGRGHVEHRDGIVADLRDAGHEALVLLPWETTTACDGLAPDLADAVFGITPLADEIPAPPPSPCPGAPPDQRPR